MDQFRVETRTRNGLLVLSSDSKKPAPKKSILYAGGKPAAEVLETIASVNDPRYLAQPLAEVKNGAVLRSKR